MAPKVVVIAVNTQVAVHQEPIWRERANFVIGAHIDPGSTEVLTEQLWARQIDEHRFEICCIPFFAYNLALGDVVDTDDSLMIREVFKPSGRYVFRLHFASSSRLRGEIMERLESFGALMETSPPGLVAVDARDFAHAQDLADFLQQQEDLGHLIYETGKTN